MIKRFAPLILLMPLVGLMGCSGINLESIFNNLPQVQSFLEEHPEARVVFTYWTAEEVNSSLSDISTQCEKPMTAQNMYFARVSEEDFELIAWFDESYRPLCIVKNEEVSEEVIEQKVSVENASPVKEESYVSTEDESEVIELILETEEGDECVKLKWTPYPYSDLKYYKVVRSSTNNNPKYPQDGYIAVITSRLDNTYTDCYANEGINYYGVTMVTSEHGKKYTNPVQVLIDEALWSEQELAYEVALQAVEKESGCVRLTWTPWPEDINYYKVVRSTTNPEPKYPNDGYIAVISNRENTYYLDCELDKSEVNYYRITTVLDNGSKVHSNVVTID